METMRWKWSSPGKESLNKVRISFSLSSSASVAAILLGTTAHALICKPAGRGSWTRRFLGKSNKKAYCYLFLEDQIPDHPMLRCYITVELRTISGCLDRTHTHIYSRHRGGGGAGRAIALKSLISVSVPVQIISNYWTRLSKISWFVSGELSVICRCRPRQRQITDSETLTNHDILW